MTTMTKSDLMDLVQDIASDLYNAKESLLDIKTSDHTVREHVIEALSDIEEAQKVLKIMSGIV